MNVFAVLALIGSVLCLSFGTAGLFGWFFRQRELRSLSKIRAGQMVAQAQAEVRHPSAGVDLYDIPSSELPGMWDQADFMGGVEEVRRG